MTPQSTEFSSGNEGWMPLYMKLSQKEHVLGENEAPGGLEVWKHLKEGVGRGIQPLFLFGPPGPLYSHRHFLKGVTKSNTIRAYGETGVDGPLRETLHKTLTVGRAV
uniref:Uncharacterized protein n=1 Tax=Photinus pyralis TaxID=7054 RepID=A0A1Y1MYJ0_PHOPY